MTMLSHDDVIKWKHFPRNWPFVRGIHRSPGTSPHKGQWRRALMYSLICIWINDWVNNGEAGDLRRYPAHCDVTVMLHCGQGLHSTRRYRLIGIGIPIINLRRSSDRLGFIMGIPISARWDLFSEQRPSCTKILIGLTMKSRLALVLKIKPPIMCCVRLDHLITDFRTQPILWSPSVFFYINELVQWSKFALQVKICFIFIVSLNFVINDISALVRIPDNDMM